MISIKKLISVDQDVFAASLLEALLLLFDAIARDAVEYDLAECGLFRATMRRIGADLERCSSTAEILSLANDAGALIGSYSRGMERFLRGHHSELQSIIGLMTQTLLGTSARGELTAGNLRRIERQLAAASHLDDLRSIKAQLAEALQSVCDEATRQERNANQLQVEMERFPIASGHLAEADSSSEPVPSPGEAAGASASDASSDIDPVTNLPGPRAAQRFIQSKIWEGKIVYVLVLCLDRLEMIGARFGPATRDQFLDLFSKDLNRHLAERNEADELFHWGGPCFAAIMEREFNTNAARSDAFRIASTKFEHIVDVGSRSVLLPMTTRAGVIPVLNSTDASKVAQKVEAFLAERAKPAGVAMPDRHTARLL